MQKRISSKVPHVMLLLSLNQTALAAGCDDDVTPVADQALAPLREAAKSMNKKHVMVSVQLTAQTPVQKIELFNFSQDFLNKIDNSSDPGSVQANQDAAAANTVYNFLLSGQTTQPIQPSPPTGQLLGTRNHFGGPIIIAPPIVVNAVPQTKEALRDYLKSQKLSKNASLYLIARMTGHEGNVNYGFDPAAKKPKNLDEALNRSYQAFLSGKRDGGICGQIHVFADFLADILGMKDTCIASADWRSKHADPGPHDVACFRDPQSKKYYWVNYDTVTQTRSSFISEAAQQQALNENVVSASVTVGTKILNAKEKIHQMRGDGSGVLMESIHHGIAADAPKVSVDVGTIRTDVKAHQQLAGGPQASAGVFVNASDDRAEQNTRVAVGGGYARGSETKQLTQNVSLSASASGAAGGFAAQATTPKGNGDSGPNHSSTGILLTAKGEANLAWDKKLEGSVGTDAKYDQYVYVSSRGATASQPYNVLGFKGSQAVIKNPSKTLTVDAHGRVQTYFYLSDLWKPEGSSPSMHVEYESAGITSRHLLERGHLDLANSVDGYHFAKGANGIRGEFVGIYHGPHGLNYSLGAETGHVFSDGKDTFYEYATTAGADAKVTKSFSRGVLSVGLKQKLNEHRMFDSMQDGAMPQGPYVTEPKTSGSVQWVFGGKP